MVELDEKRLALEKKMGKGLVDIKKKIGIYVCDEVILFGVKDGGCAIEY